MSKVDFKKEYKDLFSASKKDFEEVNVPELQFLQVDGMGNPNSSPAYTRALDALYALAYKVKFYSKMELGKDYVVPPLEGLWWSDDMASFASGDKDSWKWTMMLLTPEWITAEEVENARAEVAAKKNPEALSEVRLETCEEGLSLQIMHLGPYDAEAPTLKRLHEEFMPANGFVPDGLHHEIYFNSPTRVAPEKLRTILRQPVKKTG